MYAKEIQVSIIVLNYNKWEYLLACIESINKLKNINYQLIIVDNASENDSVSKIFNYFNCQINRPNTIYTYNSTEISQFCINSIHNKSDVILLQAKTNKGFAFGNNIGLSYATHNKPTKYYWLLSNDTIVDVNSLSNLFESAEQNIEIGLWGSVLLEYKTNIIQAVAGNFNKLNGKTNLLFNKKNIDVLRELKEVFTNFDFPIGASLFISHSFLTSVGLLNENYYLYYEELDWVYRGQKLGWKKAIATNCIVYHKGGATISQTSKLSDIIGLRSKLLFTLKYIPYTTPIIYLTLIVFIFNRIRRKQHDRIVPSLKVACNPHINIDQLLILINNKK